MVLQCTETFDQTWLKYHDKLSDEEWRDRCDLYKKEGIEGLPSYFRYTQVVSMGGSRSSKTWSILQILLTEMITRRDIKITVWRATKTECRANVMDDFIKILRGDDYVNSMMVENKQKATFTYLPTNSKIVFEGSDDVGKVLGSEQTISFFNEVTEFNYDVYLQICQRTAERVICDYNPSKSFWLEKYRFDEETTFIHSDFRKNKFCPVAIQRRLLGYEPWVPGSYEVRGAEIFVNGKPLSPTNQPPKHEKNWLKGTANEYMWLVYGLGIGAEKPNKIYKGWSGITEEFFDNLPYDSYFSIDFGSSVPTAVVEVKYNGDDAFYIKPRFYRPLQEVEDNISTMLKINVPEIRDNHALLVGDSAKQKYIDALLDGGFNADGATKGPGSVDLGISAVQHFSIYCVWDEDLKSEYDEYSWDVDKNGKSRDIPLKKNDHYMDAIRYIITYLIEYLSIPL